MQGFSCTFAICNVGPFSQTRQPVLSTERTICDEDR